MNIDPTEIRIAVASLHPTHCGSRGVPRNVVLGMHAHYRRTQNLRVTGAVFRRTANSLHYLFRKHGLPTRPRGCGNHRLPDTLVAQWYALYREHRSLEKVGAIVGRNGNSIANVFRVHGWPVRRRGTSSGPRIPAQAVGRMYEHYIRTGSLAGTAAAFGRTRNAMRHLFRSRGLRLKSPGAHWRAAA